jgi:hypothetical protein
MPRVVAWMNDPIHRWKPRAGTRFCQGFQHHVPAVSARQFFPALRPPSHFQLRAGLVWARGQKAHIRIITIASLPRKRGVGSCSRAQPLSYRTCERCAEDQ